MLALATGEPEPTGVASPQSAASYLVIGAGGLGCPALLGLVGGGARRISIVDGDVVSLDNLPRQVLYAGSDVGAPKVDAARWALRPAKVEIETFSQKLDPAELLTWLDERASHETVVLECSDSPRLKFAVHDACVARGLRVVVGGVVGWHGQAMAVDPRRPDTACYRCVFEAPPPRELTPACAEVGVANTAAGTVGHAMALLAMTAELAGVCLHFDLLRATVRRLAPKPRPDCPTCNRNLVSSPA